MQVLICGRPHIATLFYKKRLCEIQFLYEMNFSFKKMPNVERHSNFESFHTSNLKMMKPPCCTHTHQGYFQRYQEITHQFLFKKKLTSKLNLLCCKSNHKIFFILKENPKRRTLTLMKNGCEKLHKDNVSFHRWALYVRVMVFYWKVIDYPKLLSNKKREQHLVSWACTRKRLYFVTSADMRLVWSLAMSCGNYLALL